MGLFLATTAILPAQPASPVRVACVGDSITWGVGASSPEQSYPSQLARMLGDGYKVDNFGVSGSTLLSKGDLPYVTTASFKRIPDDHPNIVVIMLGTNDTKPGNWALRDRFTGDYRSLIASLSSLDSKPRIFLCTPPFSTATAPTGANEPCILREIPMIEAVAKEASLTVIDVQEATKGRSQPFPDSVHPNDAGAGLIAGTVYQAITGHDFMGKVPPVSQTK